MASTETTEDLEATIEIAAPPATVWSLVADPTRAREWSPQVLRTFVRGRPVQQGTTFLNLNHRGPLVWPTTAKVTTFDPHVRFAFRVTENRTTWSFTLAPTADGGTRLTNRRETAEGISGLSLVMTRVALGGVDTFTDELRAGMRETLAKIKAAAEASA
ncbi:SRPBCC family protein [Nocardioides marmotae]|uniref:SRPBCC family protein n=1 Tax=Nocardioides marmotae TaxID=2663857 RepID=A0A6I3JDW3_9ACTN|nr:SRPBCC family protein [Nocardioides marmotae]MCR6032648.1 SRPBCC family protein [Gordonia jinghuaiqii]MBC9732400.1 SRPBCC family protein [Nocardioides marmotae]MTB83520.1 SRPBCC family protein [Nocardioides marmotae]MTB96297.1 SRPBCC family protein [Nocardioides marmotae]QKE03213.1 SRPBCC family protein [Nocardioides marmotae]